MKQHRIYFLQKQMVPLTGDFCQNIAEEDSIKEHMEKYKDIFCSISEFKNLDVKSNVKNIEKVNILVFNQLQHSSTIWTIKAVLWLVKTQ